MKLITSGIELQNTITENLKVSTSLVIVSAYVTSSGTRWLLDQLCRRTEVTVIGRFSPRDFVNGSSDTGGIRQLIEAGHCVKSLCGLHAKVTLFNDNLLLVGSANLSSRGYGLHQLCNLEATTMITPVSMEDRKWIYGLIDSSTPMNLMVLEKIDNFIASLPQEEQTSNIYEEWPHNIFSVSTDLLVSDLPLAPPLERHEYYSMNKTGDFSRILAVSNNYQLARSSFLISKSYLWLKNEVDNSPASTGLSFGEVSQRLHRALQDDPSPFRRTVKDLQSNLYEFVDLYASDKLEIYKPGRTSQFIRTVVEQAL